MSSAIIIFCQTGLSRGTLTLKSTERQSAPMSKITIDGWTRSGRLAQDAL